MLKKKFVATSPNKRFEEGAAAINGKPLQKIEVHGKNLFYFWGSSPDAADTVVMHVHFGMSGFFGAVVGGGGREATPTTRLTLTSKELDLTAHLSAMTVLHGGLDYYEKASGKLGEDPLREGADAEAVWAKVCASKKSIGALLMDQTVIAGVGNIYRAEILFKAGVHPEQPGNTLDRATFDKVWRHSVLLLQRGFKTGSILTVDPEEAARLGPPWTRRYIYNQKSCGRCGTAVSTWDMAARKVYACETCQPLQEGTVIPEARTKALKAASPTKTFVSHCAPDPPAEGLQPDKLTVAALRDHLLSRGLPAKGKKATLVAALSAALSAQATVSNAAAAVKVDAQPAVKPEQDPQVSEAATVDIGGGAVGLDAAEAAEADSETFPQEPLWQPKHIDLAPSTPAQPKKTRRAPQTPVADVDSKQTAAQLKEQLAALGLSRAGRKADLLQRLQLHAMAEAEKVEGGTVQPGTAQLGDIQSAKAAALEKRRAGENRAVEHVALADGDSLALDSTDAKPRRKRSRK